ncbi:MAG: HIT family protein [Acidimicrobiia bacterium]|nr:HIT family protein [Acidimicrobiia bacterium]
MARACVFCEIVAHRARAFEIFRDESTMAFLDRTPLFPGHVLVIPLAHHDTLTDVPVDALGPLLHRAQCVAGLMETALGAEGSFVAINNRVSQSVPHLHVHVVPRRRKDGLRGFFWPRNPYDDDRHAADVATRLAEAYTAIVNR